MGRLRTASVLLASLILGGCASTPPPAPAPVIRDTVVLLPATAEQGTSVVVSVLEGTAAAGQPHEAAKGARPAAGPGTGARASGVVTVTTAAGTVTLDKPYETAEVTDAGGISTRQMDEGESGQRFGSTVAAQPPRPVSFTLYFIEGTDRLTPESVPTLNQVKAIMAGWPAPEVSAIGHTDRLGSDAANDKLGLQRAEMVKRALVEVGIDAGKIEIVSRGEREPIVPTDDEVAEPRNRRVEINVR